MIRFIHKGDFKDLKSYLSKAKYSLDNIALDQYGQEGVAALMSVTPVSSGETASSWSYRITKDRGIASISFHNSNIQNGVNIAVILQYGHATRNGGWIQGRDYINPVIQPIFDNIVKSAWKEVTKV